jgi:hypothetical protein
MVRNIVRVRRIVWLLAAVALGLPSAALGGQARATVAVCQPSQPGCTVHRYVLAARIRPLFFWVGKDNVGEARLSWLKGPDGQLGYGMLIGSDPGRAPRRINKWGYVSEIEERGEVQVFGLMTSTGGQDQSFDEAKGSVQSVPDGSQVYKVIDAALGPSKATAALQKLGLSPKLTLHDLDAVISQIPVPHSSTSVSVPHGTQPGFLFAMTSLMRENVETAARTGRAAAGGRRAFTYANKMYFVTTRSSRLVKTITIKGREYRNVIESEFEARSAQKSSGATYRIVYGTEGALREVPVRAVYRPNWWFEAEVVLAD